MSERPGLSDLVRPIAGGVPPEILRAWSEGDRDEARATALLEPFRRQGTVVCTDAAGLSRLTQEEPPLRVLRLVSRPKAIVHGLGVGIGGRAIGTWVADNTATFFPAKVLVDDVVRALHDLHRRLPADAPSIGVAMHTGEFWELGGGLHGPDAALVNRLAEHDAPGGATLVTDAVRERLSGAFRLSRFGDAWRVDEAPTGEDLACEELGWPAPWDLGFAELLDQGDDADVGTYERHGAIVVIERCGDHEPGLAGLLDALAADAALHALIAELDVPRAAGGRIALLAFGDAGTAVDAALGLRDRAERVGLSVRAGVDRGSALIFPLGDDAWQFAGDAVNLASKLAEDVAAPGSVLVSDRAADRPGAPFRATVSGIALSGIAL